jgi:hypothetical protein
MPSIVRPYLRLRIPTSRDLHTVCMFVCVHALEALMMTQRTDIKGQKASANSGVRGARKWHEDEQARWNLPDGWRKGAEFDRVLHHKHSSVSKQRLQHPIRSRAHIKHRQRHCSHR